MKIDRIPNPGSKEAKEQGCTCPVMDNAHGWGFWKKGIFVMNQDCPLHGWDEKDE